MKKYVKLGLIIIVSLLIGVYSHIHDQQLDVNKDGSITSNYHDYVDLYNK